MNYELRPSGTIFEHSLHIHTDDVQADHRAGVGIRHPGHRWASSLLLCFWMPHETTGEQPGQGKSLSSSSAASAEATLSTSSNNHHQHDRNHRSQKEELSDEEEKPLTLSNGISPGGEPADNGKPQNGHVVLSPPVSDILLCHLFILFHIF